MPVLYISKPFILYIYTILSSDRIPINEDVRIFNFWIFKTMRLATNLNSVFDKSTSFCHQIQPISISNNLSTFFMLALLIFIFYQYLHQNIETSPLGAGSMHITNRHSYTHRNGKALRSSSSLYLLLRPVLLLY